MLLIQKINFWLIFSKSLAASTYLHLFDFLIHISVAVWHFCIFVWWCELLLLLLLLLDTKSILFYELRCLLVKLVWNCSKTYRMIASLTRLHHHCLLIYHLLSWRKVCKTILAVSHLLVLLLLWFWYAPIHNHLASIT